VHTTLEQCLMSISTIARQAQGIHAGEVITVVWTFLGPLPWWVPGPTTRWPPGTT
jgi:hypothetical protein